MNRNNFDIIRLALASGVMLVHIADLSQRPEFGLLRHAIDSALCVYGFFAISGYLVTSSLERSPELTGFMLRRLRRLLPGYLAVLIGCVVAGSLITSHSAIDYWLSGQTWRYLLANLVFLNLLGPSLPGVFENCPGSTAVNGSLWSLRIELFCYCVLPAIAWLSRSNSLRWLRTQSNPIIAAMILWGTCLVIGRWLEAEALARSVPSIAAVAPAAEAVSSEQESPGAGDAAGLSPRLTLEPQRLLASGLFHQLRIGIVLPVVYFFLGSLLWSQRVRLDQLSWPILAGCLLVVCWFWSTRGTHSAAMLMSLPLTILFLWSGVGGPYLGNWLADRDLSYGIYLWHFPVIQTLVGWGWFDSSPSAALAGTVLLSVGFAWFSWHWIERPWLARRPSPLPLGHSPG